MKLLILGGYGVFGGRLAELMSDIDGLTVLMCGRSAQKAKTFCETLSGAAQFIPFGLDRTDIAKALLSETPDLVIDASGPFQGYGEAPYAVVQACIDARVNYLDFADAADFVFGISDFDVDAKAAGVTVLSGVSSFPVLSAAVLREMSKTMIVKSVTGGVAPSPHAGIGLNVMRAVASYAGGPMKLRRGGQDVTAYGLTESLRYTVAVPGHVPLRNIHFSLVDVPDLQVIPRDMPEVQSIWMGAGTVPEPLHRILNVFAKLRRTLRLPSLAPLAPLFYRVLNLMKFGEHRGGMFVEAIGERNGREVTQSWHLLAEGDDGPYIPSFAAEAIVRKWMNGERPEPGARAATRALDLSDYEALFKTKNIYAALREDNAALPLYRQILGSAFERLDDAVQTLHDTNENRAWSGQAQCFGASNPMAAVVGRLFGFPPKAKTCPVTVTFTLKDGAETWTRNFGGQTFSSVQYAGEGRNARLLMERFGPITAALAVTVENGRLQLVPRRWFFLGLPLPKWALPKPENYEYETDGRFHFDVTIAAPLIGRIASYKGSLTPDAPPKIKAS